MESGISRARAENPDRAFIRGRVRIYIDNAPPVAAGICVRTGGFFAAIAGIIKVSKSDVLTRASAEKGRIRAQRLVNARAAVRGIIKRIMSQFENRAALK